MTLRPGETAGHGIAVFPFLKTMDVIQLGNFSFRSTEDTTGLTEEDSAHVHENFSSPRMRRSLYNDPGNLLLRRLSFLLN